METFAGFAEHTDEQIGRLVDALQEMSVLDNTLFIYIVGDNGASAEGGPEGNYNELMALNGIIGNASQIMNDIDEWGSPNPFAVYLCDRCRTDGSGSCRLTIPQERGRYCAETVRWDINALHV